MRCDLHTHSFHSDGILAPAEVVAHALEGGVELLALTDHDVTDGLDEARAAAEAAGIRFLPGVEISTTWEGMTIHIVGLGIDPASTILQAGLKRLRDIRHERAAEIDRRLAKHRIPGTLAGAAALARGAIVSRTHFARYLLSQGYVTGIGQAFRRYLGRGCPGHTPTVWVPIEEAIGWIRAASGVAVLAHPARYKLSSGKRRKLLAEFKAGGGHAIEVVSGAHSPDEARRFAQFAQEFGLEASLGSDYHGPFESGGSWTRPGCLAPLPPECTPVWHRWAA
ncbi:MAG: PHP domain-containing protein [Pseudomonadota bacterium]